MRSYRLLRKECEKRGIAITDWHLHIRGGMTPEMAVERERASGVRSSTPKDLSRWLEAIVWLDLEASDIWSPADLKR